MDRRRFLAISGGAAALMLSSKLELFAKKPIVEEKRNHSIASLGKTVIESERKTLGGLIRVDYDKCSHDYELFIKEAITEYRKKYGNAVPNTLETYANALMMSIGMFSSKQGFSYSLVSTLSEAMEYKIIDCDTSVLIAADFLLSLGVNSEKLGFFRTLASRSSDVDHVMLRVDDYYFETVITSPSANQFDLSGYYRKDIQENFPQAYDSSFDDESISQNWGGILEVLSRVVHERRKLAIKNPSPEILAPIVQLSERSISLERALLSSAPKNPAHWNGLGALLGEAFDLCFMGNEQKKGLIYADEALSDFNKAIELYPQYSSAFMNRAQMKHRLGDTVGAIEDMESAIKWLAPGSGNMKTALNQLLNWKKLEMEK